MNINYPDFVGKALPDDRAFLDAMKSSKTGRELVAEREKSVLEFRKVAAAKLTKLEASAEASFPKLRNARDNAIAASRVAQIAWHKAVEVAQQADRDITAANVTHSRELNALEQQLTETASPEIPLFLAEMRDLHDATFKAFGFYHEADTNIITGARKEKTINNKASVLARQEAIRDAQADAEAMRLEPDQSAVSARLQELRSNLPAIAGI